MPEPDTTPAATEPAFGGDGCTCIPFTHQGGEPRYCNPTDTVDTISGWERGTDCPHHTAVAESDAARLERRAAQMARALGVPETSTWLELTLAAVTATQGLKRIQARVEQAEADLATSEALVAAQRRVIQRQARDSLAATTGPRTPRQRRTSPAPDNRNGEDQ